MKKIYIDVETSGLQPWNHEIWQIAGILEIDGEVVETFNFVRDASTIKAWEPKALDMYTRWREKQEEIEELSYNDFVKAVITVLNKYVNKKSPSFFSVYGYYVKFDISYLIQMFSRCEGYRVWFNDYFYAEGVEVSAILSMYLEPIRHMLPDFKLETIAEVFGVNIVAHDALSDIMATRELLIDVVGRSGFRDVLNEE